jgi:hypothetical protein
VAVTAVPEPGPESVETVAILASAARTAGGEGPAVTLAARFSVVVFELVVSGLGTGGNLDVIVQQSLDGANWDDLVHFLTVGSAGPIQVQSATFPRRERDAGPEVHVWTDGTLAAGSVVSGSRAVGRRFRAVWTLGSGAWTFQVLAHVSS